MAGKVKRTGLLGNWIVRNLLSALVVFIVLLVGSMIFLNVVTKHNQELIVPELSNMSVADAESIAVAEGMRVEVVDSVFVKRMKKGAVYRQNPVAGSNARITAPIICVVVIFERTWGLDDTLNFSLIFSSSYFFLFAS